ncbi:CBS domain-containing protein [Rhodovarius sp.]|uniref:CBS domain-containing protein n=1 Tax=Rhodovarius sp. TaxID=2972673 RepID=UPI0034A376BA
MKIKDRPEFSRKSQVLTFLPHESVFTAVQVMSEKNYGSAVIISPDRRPIGIVTERDLMRRLLNQERDPKTTALADIMTTDLKVARADDNLLDWLRQMSNDRFRHLPIVDEDGILVGIMSQGDFVSYTWPQLLGRLGEQTRATFNINPSIFTAIGCLILVILTAGFTILVRR